MHRPCRRVRSGGLLAGLAALILLAALSPAGATTIRRIDLPELIASANRIVHARAVENVVFWDDEGLRIYTDTTFEVLAEAKGAGPSTLTLNLLGGRIDPLEMTVEGTPVFTPGEEVVLFALDRPDGKSNLVGFTQGVRRVSQETVTSPDGRSSLRKIAVSEVPLGVTILEERGPGLAVVRPSPLRAPLERLLDEIRGIVAGTRPPGPVLLTEPQAASPAGGINP
jgi:hypothetical protein